MPTNVALMLAKAGSVSLRHKNVVPICGIPCCAFPLLSALSASKLNRIYTITDFPQVKDISERMGIPVIDEPEELAQPNSLVYDVMKYALPRMDDFDNLVILFANSPNHEVGLINRCLQRLEEDDSLTSVITGKIDNAVHPYRTRWVDGATVKVWHTTPAVTDAANSNRQSLRPECFVPDITIWTLRKRIAFAEDTSLTFGPGPFPYFGSRVGYVLNSGAPDIHSLHDVVACESWMREHGGHLLDRSVNYGW